MSDRPQALAPATASRRVCAEDGTRLYMEETGTGRPVLFIHEFAGDLRGWEPQVRALSRTHRCIAYNARGYPPSDVPTDRNSYSQARAVSDAIAVLNSLEIPRAHVVGLSMGGFAALHLALRHPDRIDSAVVAGCGYGSQPEREGGFRKECQVIAESFKDDGAAAVAERYAVGPARVQLQNKNPRAWREFATRLAEHSSEGAALTMAGVQASRPSLYDLRSEFEALRVPVLLITGDEDEGCLEPNLMLKRAIPSAGLAILPQTGHTCNLEEPEVFTRLVSDFIASVEADAWRLRDPRSRSSSTTGMSDDGDGS